MAKIQDLGGSEEGSRWWSGEEVGDGSEQDRGKRGKVSMEERQAVRGLRRARRDKYD